VDQSRRYDRRSFLRHGGRAAAGAAATGLAWPALFHLVGRPSASSVRAAEGIDPADLDPVVLAGALVRFDTSHNGEGGITRPYAERLASKWARAGVPTELIPTPKPDNVHFIARLAGTGAAAPLLFLGHSDVVSVERDRWTVDPYAGVERDGFLYGRGSLDMKGANAAFMSALLRHRSEGARFDRDIIYLADCDEEGGPYGTRWLAERHWDRIAAGTVLTEGGWLLAQRDGTTPMLASLTCQDKISATVELSTRGTTTHSAHPVADARGSGSSRHARDAATFLDLSAIVRLDRALARLSDYQPDVVLTDLTRGYFKALAESTDDARLARAVRLMLSARHRQERNRAGAVVVARSGYPALHHSLMRPTLAAVIQQAGYRTNVIPGSATAQVNVRFLPGGPRVGTILGEIREAIGDDGVSLRFVGRTTETPEQAQARIDATIARPPSRTDTDVFAAWEAAVGEIYPGTRTVGTLFEAGTSAGPWRERDIPAYGLYPYVVDNDTFTRMHGNDERVGTEALRRGTELVYRLLARFRVS
jgi:acetylornithine deacetylase/succinyl-diaminopimelate desuccinylase-like protein